MKLGALTTMLNCMHSMLDIHVGVLLDVWGLGVALLAETESFIGGVVRLGLCGVVVNLDFGRYFFLTHI